MHREGFQFSVRGQCWSDARAGTVVLFPTRIYGGAVDTPVGRQYDVATDGRFLINTVLDSAAAPITLLQNWRPPVKP